MMTGEYKTNRSQWKTWFCLLQF